MSFDSKTDEKYVEEVNKWHEGRLKALKVDDGWLTLCGLFWLDDGPNTMGKGTASKVQLPCGPASAGAVVYDSKTETVKLVVKEEAGIIVDGKHVVGECAIETDHKFRPTIVRIKDTQVSFTAIKRATKMGIRVKDNNSAVKTGFTTIERFPTNAKWRLQARYQAFPERKTLNIINAVGLPDPQVAPGSVHFEVNGAQLSLDVIDEDPNSDQFWIIFKDLTNGKETYGMRYLYIQRPAANSTATVVDFNRAYNPPCCFTDYATCAVPPKQNRLNVRIEAGEKNYGDHDDHSNL